MKNPEFDTKGSENARSEVKLSHAELDMLIEYSKALENAGLDEEMKNHLKEKIASLINTDKLNAIQPINGFVRVKAWGAGQGSRTYDIGITKETLGKIEFVASNSRE